MCGLSGYYNKNVEPLQDTGVMTRLLEGQHHRGPDDRGIRAFSFKYSTSHEFPSGTPQALSQHFEGLLGFNRLAILDLSKNGHQPMCSSDEKVMLMLNGEIYNAFDCKKDLVDDGYSFRSNTDTEVVLNLYLKHGFEKMIAMLNGMFAIVLVDLRVSKLFLARDRFGIKPLYLYERADLFAFASEIKSFLHLPGFSATLNNSLLDEYLLFRNNINRTLFKNVTCLEPGHYLEFSPQTGSRTVRYFDIENYERAVNRATLEDSLALLKNAISTSVKRQLLSDVKLGCQLSGGVDSSLVTYFAKAASNGDLLETVSVIFDDPVFNEEPYMNRVSDRVGVISHRFRMEPSYYLKSFEKATWHFEGPLNHPNTIGIYLLSEKARQFVTVLLSGEGADEVFGGYSRFAKLNNPFQLRTIISGLKKNRSTPLAFLKHYSSGEDRAILSSAFMTAGVAADLKTDFNFASALEARRAIYRTLTGSTFDKQVKYEMKTYLPDLLIRQDKMSMAHSIENRVPFLDNEIVERSFAIPESHLLPDENAHQNNKYALKKLAAEIFDDSFAFREKQGFGIPLRTFFNDKEFRSYLGDEIIPGILKRRIFDGNLIARWFQHLNKISAGELEALWIMVSFEAWAKKFNVS
jgi:asparagine synthase (glutamine-hydrolysing)